LEFEDTGPPSAAAATAAARRGEEGRDGCCECREPSDTMVPPPPDARSDNREPALRLDATSYNAVGWPVAAASASGAAEAAHSSVAATFVASDANKGATSSISCENCCWCTACRCSGVANGAAKPAEPGVRPPSVPSAAAAVTPVPTPMPNRGKCSSSAASGGKSSAGDARRCGNDARAGEIIGERDGAAGAKPTVPEGEGAAGVAGTAAATIGLFEIAVVTSLTTRGVRGEQGCCGVESALAAPFAASTGVAGSDTG